MTNPGPQTDRKALARDYKGSRRPMGVYCVRNLQTGETLIGRSIDLPAILNRERTSLRFGGHPIRRLQQDWNALGPDAFTFDVLDTLTWPDDAPDFDPTDELVLLEAMWRERMQPDGAGNYATRSTPARP
ncbi:GIY-YIG nuclease family protein [Gemmatimonas groenlandica]|uniref:GIY-YIG nuclease family protein n=1 Tax=Gemmatimonas groenlandica TaxID=2732249 RepID=A0A6M4IPU7_9BACT|nr:GIY-YIG nuclease family protein [Gemmatimonas groenlandica]QJR36740.1 GIY-YIG nuclease family protein [Gemmatimonas groenlandica]